MIKHQNNKYGYGVKLFQKTKCSCLILHQNSMFYNDSSLHLLQRYSSKENSPMFYSNSNDDNNYVIKLIIPKIVIM
jgi:hypothetical protein